MLPVPITTIASVSIAGTTSFPSVGHILILSLYKPSSFLGRPKEIRMHIFLRHRQLCVRLPENGCQGLHFLLPIGALQPLPTKLNPTSLSRPSHLSRWLSFRFCVPLYRRHEHQGSSASLWRSRKSVFLDPTLGSHSTISLC